jgi:threonine dehydratase
VIAGQGTVFLEMFQQFQEQEGQDAEFDAILCPIGGGIHNMIYY